MGSGKSSNEEAKRDQRGRSPGLCARPAPVPERWDRRGPARPPLPPPGTPRGHSLRREGTASRPRAAAPRPPSSARRRSRRRRRPGRSRSRAAGIAPECARPPGSARSAPPRDRSRRAGPALGGQSRDPTPAEKEERPRLPPGGAGAPGNAARALGLPAHVTAVRSSGLSSL